MSKNNINRASGGITWVGLLGVALVVLKLTGQIDLSWWWVTLPFWFGWGMALLIIVVAGIAIWLRTLLRERRRFRALSRAEKERGR